LDPEVATCARCPVSPPNPSGGQSWCDHAPLYKVRNYRITLPPDIPGSRFWSLILHDNQAREILAEPLCRCTVRLATALADPELHGHIGRDGGS
jgi:hypothetical protein